MAVTCKVFLSGGLMVAAGRDEVELSLPEGATLEMVLQRLVENYGHQMEVQLKNSLSNQYVDYLLVMNGHPIPLKLNLDKTIQDGDEVAILAICSGG